MGDTVGQEDLQGRGSPKHGASMAAPVKQSDSMVPGMKIQSKDTAHVQEARLQDLRT